VPRRPARPPRGRRDDFVNWVREVRSSPSGWEHPRSEPEVRAVVEHAHATGRRIRVVGAGHSWSAIAAPDDLAVSLDAWPFEFRVDADRALVTVPAGVRIRDLTSALARVGLALPIVGSIQAQSVAGAIATGTHGSSLVHGNLASLVTGVRIVAGDGRVHAIDDDDPRLPGARVHLGALGVLTGVTLRVEPAGFLEQTIEQVRVADMPAALPAIATSAEYVKVWWLPHAETAQVVRYRRVAAPTRRRRNAAVRRWVDETVMHRALFPALVAAQHRRPALAAATNRRMATTYLGPTTQSGRATLMLNTPMPIRHRETEAALPLERAPAAVAAILDLFAAGRPAANFPLEIRFVRRDDAWMSPAYGADTCQIGAYSTHGPDCDDYFSRFWAAVAPYGPRPHWGKEMDQTATELRPCYPAWNQFRALRDELDPDRTFTGPWHRRTLGD
jgi:FAD/FMN-containing dehydrogenase